jgi:7,8-dihydro-6-hydroxymethylpterin-pyrophosphokinase
MKTNNQENAHEVEEQHAFSSTYVQVSKKDVNQPRFINAATSLDTYGQIFEAHTNICSGKLKVVKRTMKF